MTDADVAAVARVTARRLAQQYGQGLEAEVETAINGATAQPPEQYVDLIALGGLIVSIAALGWQIYIELAKRGERPRPDVLAERIRVEWRVESELMNAEERVIEAVSLEVVKHAGDG